MSREIEFRAWLKDKKRMVAVVDLKFLTDHYGNEKEIVYWDENINSANYAYFDEIELMQYTGLKDKNGTKIFEGDIVKRSYTLWTSKGEKQINETTFVEFDNEDLRFVFIGFDYDLSIRTERIEVIGNIYENKELLENE